MRRIRISLSSEIFLAAYKDLGIQFVFVYPGYEIDRNIEISFEPMEIEVTEEVYKELVSREAEGARVFSIIDLDVAEKRQKIEEDGAKKEYKERQKPKGK